MRAVRWPFRDPSLPRKDEGSRRRRGNDLDRREAGLAQPRTVVRLPVRKAVLRDHEHLRREQHRERMARTIIIEDEIIDDEGTARLERFAELAEDGDVICGRLLV